MIFADEIQTKEHIIKQ